MKINTFRHIHTHAHTLTHSHSVTNRMHACCAMWAMCVYLLFFRLCFAFFVHLPTQTVWTMCKTFSFKRCVNWVSLYFVQNYVDKLSLYTIYYVTPFTRFDSNFFFLIVYFLLWCFALSYIYSPIFFPINSDIVCVSSQLSVLILFYYIFLRASAENVCVLWWSECTTGNISQFLLLNLCNSGQLNANKINVVSSFGIIITTIHIQKTRRDYS